VPVRRVWRPGRPGNRARGPWAVVTIGNSVSSATTRRASLKEYTCRILGEPTSAVVTITAARPRRLSKSWSTTARAARYCSSLAQWAWSLPWPLLAEIFIHRRPETGMTTAHALMGRTTRAPTPVTRR